MCAYVLLNKTTLITLDELTSYHEVPKDFSTTPIRKLKEEQR